MRLIDADALIKELEYQGFNRDEDEIFNIVEYEPTAYNTEKVVEELKNEQIAYFMAENINCTHALRDAIDIVQKGGV